MLSGFDKEELMVGEQAMLSMMKSSSSSSSSEVTGDYLHVLFQHLYNRFFLPPVFSNTTMGAIAVKDVIESGASYILHRLLHHPSVIPILIHNAQSTIVSDETISNIEATNDQSSSSSSSSSSLDPISTNSTHSTSSSIEHVLLYVDAYNRVKSSNAITVMNHLVQSKFVLLQVTQPCYCESGWGEFVRHLYVSPSPTAKRAFQAMWQQQQQSPHSDQSTLSEEEQWSERVSTLETQQSFYTQLHSTLTTSQFPLMKPKQQFVHQYYLDQLQSEFDILLALITSYEGYLTDEYAIEDWLQGLIELENITSSFYLHAQLLVHEMGNEKMDEFTDEQYQGR